jgi:hypothetical protein
VVAAGGQEAFHRVVADTRHMSATVRRGAPDGAHRVRRNAKAE